MKCINTTCRSCLTFFYCCSFNFHQIIEKSSFIHSYFLFFFFSYLMDIDQVMLYVDGMNGVMKHGPTVQWLYTLIASKYRLVVKTALKLLLVFVEYCEGNCYLLVNAIRTVDTARGSLPWTNIMKWVYLTGTFLCYVMHFTLFDQIDLIPFV